MPTLVFHTTNWFKPTTESKRMLKTYAAKLAIHQLIATLTLASIGAYSNAQTIKLESDTKTGHGFITNEGTITALHVGIIEFDYIDKPSDVAINTKRSSPDGYMISDQPPSYFIDRRGKKHEVEAIGKLNAHTTLSIEFYAGESGMPIFAKDGTVCCVVVGNAKIKNRWRGIVSRIFPLLNFTRKHRRKLLRQTLKSF